LIHKNDEPHISPSKMKAPGVSQRDMVGRRGCSAIGGG